MPTIKLAAMQHESWIAANDKWLKPNDPLRKRFADLPRAEQLKDFVVVNLVLSLVNLLGLFDRMVESELDTNNDNIISAEEFHNDGLMAELRHPGFRIPLKRGHISC